MSFKFCLGNVCIKPMHTEFHLHYFNSWLQLETTLILYKIFRCIANSCGLLSMAGVSF